MNQERKGNLISARNFAKTFISAGFFNWKKALQICQEHQESECHKVGVDYEVVFPKMHTDVVELANETTKKLRRENRRCFAKILQSLRFLVRQGLSLRGNDDINSNFFFFFFFFFYALS